MSTATAYPPPPPALTETTTLRPVIVLSLLHEGPTTNSATRLFNSKPVLTWTLNRLAKLRTTGILPVETPFNATPHPPSLPIAIAFWSDQQPAIESASAAHTILPLSAGPRQPNLAIDTVAAAQRWADGWRSGPMATCHFDRGFSAAIVAAALKAANANAALLIDPAAALVDPHLLQSLLGHAQANPDRSLIFSPAAPGLSGLLLRAELVHELVQVGTHPGRALHYVPDNYAHDPIATPAAAPTPPTAARTLRRFSLDNPEQIRLLERATASLSAQLPHSTATELVDLANADTHLPRLPRDLRIELTTNRIARPIFIPTVTRPERTAELSPAQWLPLLDQLAEQTTPSSNEFTASTRLTFAGLGDPLLYPGLLTLLSAAADRGIPTALETDLLSIPPETIESLARSPLDILLLHLPAATPAIYAQVMGIDALAEALTNLSRFVQARRPRGVPIVIPIFTKLKINQHEMEAWYDHYLRSLGSAVIDAPQYHAARDLAVADMSPPERRPCRRLASRMQILSNGSVAQCDLDTTGSPAQSILATPLADIWSSALAPLRTDHAAGRYSLNVLCSSCKDWHRP